MSGNAPSRTMEPIVAKKVKGDVTTASPGPISRAMSAARMASVPEDRPMACGTPQ